MVVPRDSQEAASQVDQQARSEQQQIPIIQQPADSFIDFQRPSTSRMTNNFNQQVTEPWRQPIMDKLDINIQRLKGSQNWASWKWQVMNALDVRGLRNTLVGEDSLGSPSEVATRQILSSSLDQSLICKVSHCNSAQEIWKCLRSLFENNTSFALTDMISQMNSYKMETLNDVETGISTIQLLASQIKAMGGHADQFTIESAILRALPESFEPFIASWSFFDPNKRTVENLQSYLLQAVSRMRLRDNKTSPKDKALIVSQSHSKEKPAQSSQKGNNSSSTNHSDKTRKFCRYCKKRGHEISECLKLKKKKKESETNKDKSDQSDKDNSKATVSDDKSTNQENSVRVAYGHVAKALAITSCLSSNTLSSESNYMNSIWVADSGASFHMTSHIEWLAGYVEFTNKISVKLGNNEVVLAHGRGFIETSYGVLDPVYYLPKIGMNLFSISACARNHQIFALTTDKEMIFLKDGEELFKGYVTSCGIYEIRFNLAIASYVSLLSTSLMDWHDRLGHCSIDTIKHMVKNKVVEGIFVSNDSNNQKCISCAKNKITKASHRQRTSPRAAKSGQILHLDTVGKFPIESLGGNFYYVLCKDSFSGYRRVFFVPTKDMIPNGVKQLITQSIRETGNEVLQIVTDNGTEFINHDLKEFLGKHGINSTTSAVYTPQQNGLIERDIRTVAEAAACLRSKANLPKEFWAEAVSTAVYSLNRTVNTLNQDQTPFELWFGRKPSLKNLKKFGETAIVYTESHARDKLDEKGTEMIFVGYTETFNTLRFIDPVTNHLFISCNYRFLDKGINPIHSIDDQKVDEVHFETYNESNPRENTAPNQSYHNPNNSLVDSNDNSDEGEHIYDEPDINKTFDISTYQVEHIYKQVDRGGPSVHSESVCPSQLFEEPADMPPEQNRDEDRLKSLRPRITKPNYMGYKINLSTLDAESDPQSFDEATHRPDAEKWFVAMREELESLRKNNVWILVKRPNNRNIVTNRWVYRIKRSPDGNIERYRARLVARGFSQIEGIDYYETYSPTVSMPVVRFLLAHAAVEGWFIRQFDIKTAFLYGDLEEEVFMHQPQGFDEGNNKVCLLKKSLYGLKQAPRQWCRKFTEFLIEMDLQVSSEDKCIFYRHNPLAIIIIYVDDGVIFARTENEADNLIKQLASRFEIHSMQLSTFLGFQIKRPSMHQIILHQQSYTNKVLKKFGGNELKSERSPISPNGVSSDESTLDPKLPYREIIGSLLYGAITTRIDIAFPVGLASRMVQAPKNKHWFLVQRIMRYLHGHKNLGLSYEASEHKGLIAYCDSDYANDETGRSTSGMIFMYAGAPIHWRSIRQSMVTLSPSEAETVSLCSTVKELIWLRNIGVELNIIDSKPTTIFCDSTAAIRLCTSERAVHRTKHIRAQFTFCQEQVENKTINLEYVPTKLQLADWLTKPLPVNSFIEARNKMMKNIEAKALFVAMAASILLPSSAFKFDIVGPILYQSTDKFVDTGVAEYSIDYSFMDTCDLLKKHLPPKIQLPPNTLIIATNEEVYIQSFIEKCQALYHDNWMGKIHELLNKNPPETPSLSEHVGNFRKKRNIVEIITGTVVTNFIFTLFEPLLPWSDYHKIQELKEIQAREQQRFMKFQHEFNATLHIQQGLIDLVKNNTISLREQKRQFRQFVILSSDITWLSSFIQTRILMASADLRNIIDHITRGQVATTEFAYLLNRTELLYVDPRDTEFLSAKAMTSNTIRFKFSIRLRATDTFIYQVHSFRYWDNLTHIPSLMEYRGRDYVLWNKTSNCIKGIEKPIDRAVIDECTELNYKDPSLNIWQSISSNNVYKDNSPSYKHSSKTNYIYCFPWNITIGHETTRCPMMIFKLDSSHSFETKDVSYKGIQRKIISSYAEHPFVEHINIAHFDNHKIASNNLVMFDRIQQLQKENEKLIRDQEVSVMVSKHGIAYWSTIVFVGILMILCAGLILYSLRLTGKVHLQGKQVSTELKDLRKTYESTSCIGCANSQVTVENQSPTNSVAQKETQTESGLTPNNQPVTINFGGSRPLPNLP